METKPVSVFNRTWNSLSDNELSALDSRGGLRRNIKDIEIGPSGGYEINGQKVLVYIRDQYLSFGANGKFGYKFHICDCKTIERKKLESKFDKRYVATRNTDGYFYVNYIDQWEHVIQENDTVQLSVCKDCLSKLNHNGYNLLSRRGTQRDDAVRSFDLKEYLEKKNTEFFQLPKYDAETAPINQYVERWADISREIRERRGWKCEACRIDFSMGKRFLHAHHIDGDRTNNFDSNLQALCLVCHSKAPDHKRLVYSPEFKQCKAFIANKK